MDKAHIVVVIVLYLFLSSFACAKTFGGDTWSPGLDFDIQTHDVNFTTDSNLSEMGIEILEGEWHVENGNLTSKVPGVNWFVVTDELAISKGYPLEKEYVIYGMEKLTRFTLFYGDRIEFLIITSDFFHTYWEFDVENNVIHCKTDKRYYDDVVHYSGAYDLSDVTDFTVKTYIEKPWSLARTRVMSEIYKDDVKIATAEWSEWMASEVLSRTGGVYTEQSGLKVHTIEGMKRVGVDSESAFSSLALLFKIMLYKPPTYADGTPIMALWLNLVLFKVPVFMLGLVILLIIRGTE